MRRSNARLVATGGMAPGGIAPGGATTGGRRLRICLFGLFGGGNYGNDGSLEAMLLLLREIRPDAELACVCVDPGLIGQRHRIATAAVSWPGFSHTLLRLLDRAALKIPGRLANWVRAIRHIRRFDVMLVPGTSTLSDYRSGPFGTPYGIFRWAVAARLCGTRLVFVSTGAGPIVHPLSRWMLAYTARSACHRSFRDAVSKDFLAGIGIDTARDRVCPDLVFRLPVPERAIPERAIPERAAPDVPAGAPGADRPLTIGIGVMAYNGWRAMPTSAIYDAYLAKMVRYAASLLQSGHRVRLLVGENADERMVADMGRLLGAQGHRLANPAPARAAARQLIAEPIGSLHDLMRQIADTDIVVATRFHNVVCALKLARPTVSIGYEAKNDAVMAEFGLGDFCQFVETLDLDRLERQTAELLRGRAIYRERIRQGLADIERRMAEHEAILAAAVL